MAQPEHPHGAPPGQSGEHPDNPADADDKPKPDKPVDETDDEDVEITNPIVLPEVEHHEEDKA